MLRAEQGWGPVDENEELKAISVRSSPLAQALQGCPAGGTSTEHVGYASCVLWMSMPEQQAVADRCTLQASRTHCRGLVACVAATLLLRRLARPPGPLPARPLGL